jgi:hypothetical protein
MPVHHGRAEVRVVLFDAGRIEWPQASTADPGDHHLALDVMVDGCPTSWILAAGACSGRSRRAGLTL